MSTGLRIQVDARPSVDHPLRLSVDAHFPAGEVTALFGVSGAGKTTLLRTIAGLLPKVPARVTLDDAVWQHDTKRVPAHQRSVGFAFQNGALFTHMSVAENLAFARRHSLADMPDAAVSAFMPLLDLEPLFKRSAGTLSGGERQRVGMARALLRRPAVLLLDEPLSALDMPQRQSILGGLELLRHNSDVVIVYVSHAVEEVTRLCDHIVVMNDGKCTQQGAISQLSGIGGVEALIADSRAAQLTGHLGATDTQWGLAPVQVGEACIWLPNTGAMHSGQTVRVRILARDVSIALSDATDSSIVNRVVATVADIHAKGDEPTALITLAIDEQVLFALITRRSLAHLDIRLGQTVYAQIKSAALLA